VTLDLTAKADLGTLDELVCSGMSQFHRRRAVDPCQRSQNNRT